MTIFSKQSYLSRYPDFFSLYGELIKNKKIYVACKGGKTKCRLAGFVLFLDLADRTEHDPFYSWKGTGFLMFLFCWFNDVSTSIQLCLLSVFVFREFTAHQHNVGHVAPKINWKVYIKRWLRVEWKLMLVCECELLNEWRPFVGFFKSAFTACKCRFVLSL